MRFTTIFFDLDDTLYPASSGLWPVIKERMSIYMRERTDIPARDIGRLREKYFREYGTTLRGLQAYHEIDTQDFLAFVHDIPLRDYLHPEPVQQAVLASLPTRNLVFTNADVHHAQRVLRALDLEKYFSDIVDVNRMAPNCKPSPDSFAIAMQATAETEPAKCVMIDDLTRTTAAARELGMFSILYSRSLSDPDADACFTDWRELPALLNGRD
jgi:putative hydrolase of the HAD superfamily